MRYSALFAVLLIALTVIGPAHAQDAAGQLSPAVRAQVYELLSQQCGTADEEDRFRVGVAGLGAAVEPLLLSVLADGLPADVLHAAEDHASERFERRQAWLEENGDRLFGDDAKRLADRSRADYVADAVGRVDTLFRENAVRGLGVVGGAQALAAVRAAAAQDPDLSILADQALNEIRLRQ